MNAPLQRPWLDGSLDIEVRVASLLAVMTQTEKVGQLHQIVNASVAEHRETLRVGGLGSTLVASGETAGNVRDRGIESATLARLQEFALTQSRLGIPLAFARDVIHGHRTVFPIPLAQAATWNPELVAQAARTARNEARSAGLSWVFTPMMDLAVDLRWGRIAESFGEDPYLAGAMASAAVHGYQDEAGRVGLAACAKHFVGYGLTEGGRDYSGAGVGENTLRNLHLRPFHEAVRAGVLTVMSSFNEIDGVAVTADPRWLRGVLKDEWGFDGVVVSDWNAIGELIEHGLAGDLRDAARLAIEAGVDIDMVSGAYAAHLEPLVADGVVPQALLDDAVSRVLRMKFRLGLFDAHPGAVPPPSMPAARAADAASRARRTAAESLVLLRNRGGVLPLAGVLRPEQVQQVLLAGPFAEATEELFGTWTLDGDGREVVPLSQALQAVLPPGALKVNPGTFADTVLMDARTADVVVLALGEHPQRSGEAHSVVDPRLPAGQLELLAAVWALAKPIVVVVFAGRPLVLTEVADKCDVLLFAWHPGIEGGHAVADLLVGNSHPVGHLPVTFPRSVGQVPVFYNHKPTGRPIPPSEDAHGGRYQDSLTPPLFPFGYGLHYGKVVYEGFTCQQNSDGSVDVSVRVVNDADHACTETIQIYLRDVVSRVTRPVRELVGFARVALAPHEGTVVHARIEREAFGYTDSASMFVVEPGDFVMMVGPDSAHTIALPFTLT